MTGHLPHRWTIAAFLTLAAASVVQAECVSEACNDVITRQVTVAAAYLVLIMVLLVLLLRRKTRRLGAVALAIALLVMVGIPLASQAWLKWRVAAMERSEIAGQPPAMADRVPLVIMAIGTCAADPCEAVLVGKGAAGAYVVSATELAGVDMSGPVAIADLPLEFRSLDGEGGKPQIRRLSADERREAAARIDYLVLSGLPLDLMGTDPASLALPVSLDKMLQANPSVAGLGDDTYVQLAMARLEPGAGQLSLSSLEFDLLELSIYGRALSMPLAPGHWTRATNRFATYDLAARSICPPADGGEDWFCVTPLNPF